MVIGHCLFIVYSVWCCCLDYITNNNYTRKNRYTYKEGDWKCPNKNCSNPNFAKRFTCNLCGAQKPEVIEEPTIQDYHFSKINSINNAQSSQAGLVQGLFKEGDWRCLRCHNVNFRWRKHCNRCGDTFESQFPLEYKERERENKDYYDRDNRDSRDYRERDRHNYNKNSKHEENSGRNYKEGIYNNNNAYSNNNTSNSNFNTYEKRKSKGVRTKSKSRSKDRSRERSRERSKSRKNDWKKRSRSKSHKKREKESKKRSFSNSRKKGRKMSSSSKSSSKRRRSHSPSDSYKRRERDVKLMNNQSNMSSSKMYYNYNLNKDSNNVNSNFDLKNIGIYQSNKQMIPQSYNLNSSSYVNNLTGMNSMSNLGLSVNSNFNGYSNSVYDPLQKTNSNYNNISIMTQYLKPGYNTMNNNNNNPKNYPNQINNIGLPGYNTGVNNLISNPISLVEQQNFINSGQIQNEFDNIIALDNNNQLNPLSMSNLNNFNNLNNLNNANIGRNNYSIPSENYFFPSNNNNTNLSYSNNLTSILSNNSNETNKNMINMSSLDQNALNCDLVSAKAVGSIGGFVSEERFNVNKGISNHVINNSEVNSIMTSNLKVNDNQNLSLIMNTNLKKDDKSSLFSESCSDVEDVELFDDKKLKNN